MPRSKYYNILGLESSATENEVRKKYRFLAMKYHPDRNPSESAQERFIEITEAYEILTGKKTVAATTKKTASTSTAAEKQRNREERVKEAQKRYKEQVLKEYLENERYYQSLINGRRWKLIRVSAVIGALFSFFILLDYLLPHHFEKDTVTEFKRNVTVQSGSGVIGLVKTKKENYYWVSRIDYDLFARTRDVYVESSWIFHNAIRLHTRGKLHSTSYPMHFNYYSFAWLLAIFFLVPLGTVLYKRKKISFTFFYFLSYYGVSALLVLYFLTGNRWAHVLTLGFI